MPVSTQGEVALGELVGGVGRCPSQTHPFAGGMLGHSLGKEAETLGVQAVAVVGESCFTSPC